nr:MAG TPA: hypothetical protein [Caudoviricetes sp.]
MLHNGIDNRYKYIINKEIIYKYNCYITITLFKKIQNFTLWKTTKHQNIIHKISTHFHC